MLVTQLRFFFGQPQENGHENTWKFKHLDI